LNGGRRESNISWITRHGIEAFGMAKIRDIRVFDFESGKCVNWIEFCDWEAWYYRIKRN